MSNANTPSLGIKEDVQHPLPESLHLEPQTDDIRGGGANDGAEKPEISAADREKFGSKPPVEVAESVARKEGVSTNAPLG